MGPSTLPWGIPADTGIKYRNICPLCSFEEWYIGYMVVYFLAYAAVLAKLIFLKIVCYFINYSMDLLDSRVLLPKAELVKRY